MRWHTRKERERMFDTRQRGQHHLVLVHMRQMPGKWWGYLGRGSVQNRWRWLCANMCITAKDVTKDRRLKRGRRSATKIDHSDRISVRVSVRMIMVFLVLLMATKCVPSLYWALYQKMLHTDIPKAQRPIMELGRIQPNHNQQSI